MVQDVVSNDKRLIFYKARAWRGGEFAGSL